MTRALIELTARQLLGRRRALIMLLLALLPALVAAIYRLSDGDQDAAEFTADMLDVMGLGLVLPLTALIFGTGTLGAEIEDGTAVYLLTKPVERWRIVVVKIAVAAAATILVTLPPLVLASVIALGGDEAAITPAFAVAVVVGAITYCALFVTLSIRTGRALLIGLGYVFIWEAVLPQLFSGTKWVSVHQYMLGVADLISSAPAWVLTLDADLDGVTAVVLAAVVTGAATFLGVRLLERFEIGQRL